MNAPRLIALLSAAGSAAALASYLRFRSEMRATRADLERRGSIAQTSAGQIEYAQSGRGLPALVIHGAGGGFDQGLLIAGDVGRDFRCVAPSRFGYLRTPAPSDSSPAAQADAHAALLDHLQIRDALVIGASAGAPSAIELALRHPERVSALILLVPRTYDPSRSIGVDRSTARQAILALVQTSADFMFWLALRLARSAVVRFLGVPPDVEARASEEERARVTQVARSILPLSARFQGLVADAGADISRWPLERIRAPTLVISAKDDLFGTAPGARFTAEHIPGATFRLLENGGHLMVGHTAQVRQWIEEFLRQKAAIRSNDHHVQRVLEPVR